MTFFLGIDGGGTKTRCVLGDENSSLGTGSSSSCKVQRVGEDCARDALTAAIHEACVQAGISPRQIARTCAGVTGAGRAEVAIVMRDLISATVGGEIEIIGDVEIAFEDAFGKGPGVLVIAGTGSIAYGRNAGGQTARAGGWGHAISDEGSGYWIGVEVIRAVLQGRDRGEESILLRDLTEALGAATFDEFIVRVNETPTPDYATLLPTVLKAADGGDSVANHILEHAGLELAKMAQTVIDGLFAESEKSTIAIHGGVFANSLRVRESFARCLQSSAGTVLATQDIDPARGALARARKVLYANEC